jgi:hypothetical protein
VAFAFTPSAAWTVRAKNEVSIELENGPLLIGPLFIVRHDEIPHVLSKRCIRNGRTGCGLEPCGRDDRDDGL